MAAKEKDITERKLEEYNDVFADIVNAYYFGGEQLVKEDELEPAATLESYKAVDGIHQEERDVSKIWKHAGFRIATFGIENQSVIDPDMPLRVMGYDGAAYRAQLLADKRTYGESGKLLSVQKNPRYPVSTLVLYFGKSRWKNHRSLYECLNIPEKMKPFVNDYRIHVLEVSWLTKQELELFHSDFRVVAEYFVQARKNKDYCPTPQVLKHIHEVLQLISALTGDHRLEQNYLKHPEKEEINRMDMMLERTINKRVNKRVAEVIKEMTEATKEMAEKMAAEKAEELAKKEKKEDILIILGDIGSIPENTKNHIMAETDMEQLRSWLKLSARVSSIEEFEQKMA